MKEKLYCLERGRYSYEIRCCEYGESWEEVVEALAYFNTYFVNKVKGNL